MEISKGKIEELVNWYDKIKFLSRKDLSVDQKYKEVVLLTNFLKKDTKLIQRIWHIKNNTFFIPRCCVCKRQVHFDKKQYTRTCSQKCNLARNKEMQILRFLKPNDN